MIPDKWKKVPSAWEYVDRTMRYLKHFSIKDARVGKTSDFLFPTMLIGAKPLRNFPVFTVRTKRMGILQSVYPGLCVGVVSSAHK